MQAELIYRKPSAMTSQGGFHRADSKREKNGGRDSREAIHSGHFMVSDFEAEAQDDEDELAVPVPDQEEAQTTRFPIAIPPNFPYDRFACTLNDRSTSQQLSIETSLNKLFQCMSLAYRQKLTSPKWNRFKGIRLRWKDKIRLNNVSKRCENKALQSLKFVPAFYVRYVDDIALTVPDSLISHTLEKFNSLHPRLQFTIEIGENNSLNYLDVTIIKDNNHLLFNWYQKSTASERYLNFLSEHPLCQKRGTIYGLVDRVFRLSHPKFHSRNLEGVVKILLKNLYPLRFIFETIFRRIRIIVNNQAKDNNRLNNNQLTDDNKLNNSQLKDDNRLNKDCKKFFTVPYIQSISENFNNVVKDIDINLSFSSLNKLNNFIRVHKDPMHRLNCNNVVYKINCVQCEASYVGQTSRQLKTRIREHKNHILRNTTSQSVITDHRLNHNHDFDWDNVEVLDQESHYFKRLVSEMIYIKRQRLPLNLQTDTEFLPDIYLSLIDNLPKI